MNSELNQSYRPKEAAKLLGIGAATLWRWIKERPDFPQPTRLSARCTVLDGAELRQWLAAQAKTPPSPPVVRREPFDAFAGYEPVKTKQTPYGEATAYAAKSNEDSPPPDAVEAPSEMDVNQALNDLLTRWHQWSSSYTFGKGYPSVDSACRSSKTSRQYDDTNGALDAAVENKIMEAFDAAIWTIPNTQEKPYLTALQFQARNFCTGRQVWTSPRLPTDDMERRVILMEARNILLRALARSGVMS